MQFKSLSENLQSTTMSTGTQAGPQRILLASKNPVLRETRKRILSSFGYEVVAPANDCETVKLIQTQPFGLLILGNTLEPESVVMIANQYRRHQPHGRTIEILIAPGVQTLRDADAIVVGVDGPFALQKAVEEQIGKSSS